MTVSDPPDLGWSVWTSGSAPKSLLTSSWVSAAFGPAPRPQPAAAVAARATTMTATARGARARDRLANGEHHAGRAARQPRGLVAGLVEDLEVQHVAAAAEPGRQQVAPARAGAYREPGAVRGAALLDGLELLALAVVGRARAAVVAREAQADVGQARAVGLDDAGELARAGALLVLLAFGDRGDRAVGGDLVGRAAEAVVAVGPARLRRRDGCAAARGRAAVAIAARGRAAREPRRRAVALGDHQRVRAAGDGDLRGAVGAGGRGRGAAADRGSRRGRDRAGPGAVAVEARRGLGDLDGEGGARHCGRRRVKRDRLVVAVVGVGVGPVEQDLVAVLQGRGADRVVAVQAVDVERPRAVGPEPAVLRLYAGDDVGRAVPLARDRGPPRPGGGRAPAGG